MTTFNDPLESIIGDEIRVKLLRVFVLNQDTLYIAKDFVKTLRRREPTIKETLRWLERDGILKKKKLSKAERQERGVRETVGYGFNKRYVHQEFLERIIRDSMPTEKDLLAKKLTTLPGVQCVITVNMFVNKTLTNPDILIVSSENSDLIVKQIIQSAERVIGKELKYSFLTENDFIHRMQIQDKFVTDIFDSEYKIHLDRLGVFKGS